MSVCETIKSGSHQALQLALFSRPTLLARALQNAVVKASKLFDACYCSVVRSIRLPFLLPPVGFPISEKILVAGSNYKSVRTQDKFVLKGWQHFTTVILRIKCL